MVSIIVAKYHAVNDSAIIMCYSIAYGDCANTEYSVISHCVTHCDCVI